MPEGDTIHRTANRLAAALAGRPLVRFEARRLVGSGPPPGTVIEAVEARGKHLLVRFVDGSELETHLRMTGSWHLYRPGERWRRAPATARAVLETADWVAVCFAAPDVVLRPPPRPGGPASRPAPTVAHLGPDLCAPGLTDADRAEIRRRIAGVPPAVPLVDVLLDQRVFCGVGNVYANELAHAVGLHPLTPAGAVPAATWDELIVSAHRLLRANVAGGPRRGGGVRAGRPGVPPLRSTDRPGRGRPPPPGHVLVPVVPAGAGRCTARPGRLKICSTFGLITQGSGPMVRGPGLRGSSM